MRRLAPMLAALALLAAGLAADDAIEAATATPQTSHVRQIAKREQTILQLRRTIRRVVAQRDRARRRVRRQYLAVSRLRRELHRARRRYGSIPHMLTLAAAAYGQDAGAMIRVADCESGLWPYARNQSSGAAGLAQFLPSTWRSTPFARFSIFDPFAQSLAMGWMWRQGRNNEWVCRG